MDEIHVLSKGICGASEWKEVNEIYKGWSRDKKYKIVTNTGETILLRVSSVHDYEKKKHEFDAMKQVFQLGLSMSEPLLFGLYEEYVYIVLSWIEGRELRDVLPTLTVQEQYELGREAGQILKKIHSIPAPPDQEDWELRMLGKVEKHLNKYEECPYKVENDQCVVTYIKNNLHVLKNRKQVFQHGDFHVGNMIYKPNGKIGIIDFNRCDYGDTIEEFYKMLLFSRDVSPAFARGQLDAYFDEGIPEDFFDILALYIGTVILSAIPWAVPFGIKDVEDMIKRVEVIIDDYNNFQQTIPKWYNECKYLK